MSALSAIEAPAPGLPEAGDAATADLCGGRPPLRVVRHTARPAAADRAAVAGGTREPRSSSMRAGTRPRSMGPVVLSGTVLARPRSGAPGTVPQRAGMPEAKLAAPRAGVSRTPIRLTRRGRMVVAALVVTGVTIAVLLASLLASGGAQATNHGQARAGYQGMHRVVVQPGQTLWSIASAAEPAADTRLVIQEIMTANALTSATISAGQLLWVPR